MSKQNWIRFAITVVIIIAVLAVFKLMPFYATIVAVVSFFTGILFKYLWSLRPTVPEEKA